ncbi:winged helix DNA-binding domain-containing protein [Actinokineospora bangkokensis]|uniref:Winged helix DNA-binding domain-containing protein n=1 Tax=Actinokineospora bangkokensis TaxID=1193682 RepID=A0A1Q9LNC1_9PSEU|nr:winged helix DNA-binding domain-containing protein [Actinokineospora bangkokensis]OLR93518.1 hypothetical protein BJP25_14540 [Actinokineospora bangkokensis]
MRHVSDDERRARLATRQALAPASRLGSPEAVAAAMTALHATEPPTVHLSCWARVPGFEIADVDRALHRDKTLVKQLAMRRTLFAFPRDLLPAVWASASARVAGQERAKIAKEVLAAGLTTDADAWVDRAREQVLAVLSDAPGGLQAAELRAAVPMIDQRTGHSTGGTYLATNVIVYLGARGDVVRGLNSGGWRVSRPQWTTNAHWLGAPPPGVGAAQGYRELVGRWLRTFGPGTEDDVVWWLGATKAIVRAALADLDAVRVSLDGGGTGWLLPDDLDEVADPGHWVALLPTLDPTVMGWRGRDFYLGPHGPQLFDRAGNAVTTAWVDGRIVGCWVQDEAGVVRVRLLADVPAAARRELDAEAARLTEWLGGERVTIRYRAPAVLG